MPDINKVANSKTPTEEQFICIALEYATTMNAIERDIKEQSDAAPGVNFFSQFEVRYRPVFDAYTTSKRRVYGGHSLSYGIPTKFDGIENAVESTAILKNRNRVEVYFKTENAFKAKYLFVLLKESGEWKIDNVKYRWYEEAKWIPLIL
jgi:hypothetical protein